MTELTLTETALRILRARYLLKDREGNVIETPEGMFRRVARTIALADAFYFDEVRGKPLRHVDASLRHVPPEISEKLSNYMIRQLHRAYVRKLRRGEVKVSFREFLAILAEHWDDVFRTEERFYDLMTSRRFLPNSPTLMNAGAPLGQLSACFVIPIEDSIEGIMDSLALAAKVQKSGGGCIDGNARIIYWNDDELHIETLRDMFNSYRDLGEFYDPEYHRWGIDVRDREIYVPSFDPRKGKVVKGRVTHLWRYELDEDIAKYQITTNKGTKILTSPWHPFFVFTNKMKVLERRADEIKKGDMIISAIPEVFESKLDKECWVAGFIAGDGCIDKFVNKKTGYSSNRIRIYDSTLETLEEINNFFEEKYGKRFAYQKDRHIHYITICSKEIVNRFIQLLDGIKEGIPREIMKKGTDAVLSFIAGIFDAEGHVSSKPGVELGMSNKALVEDIAYYLNSLGIKARLKRKIRRDGVDYVINIEEYTSLLLFYHLVGKHLRTSNKRMRIEVILENHKGGTFGLNINYEAFRRWAEKFGVRFKTNGSQTIAVVGKEKVSLGQWHKRGIVSKAKITKFLTKLMNNTNDKEILRLLRIIIGLEVVKDVKKTHERKVFYDLTVENYQNYLAGENGLVFVHNTGFSFSRLRPEGDIVSTTGGTASGPVSFMKLFDTLTDVIKQGGKRRGANMGVLDVHHPDVEKFITCKADGKSFQNFNISVAASDEFMEAVIHGRKYPLINPRTGEVVKMEDARYIWNLIVQNAWRTGDPGLIFIDRINKLHPARHLGKIEATNPCGEQPLLPYESCNLGSINISRFILNEEFLEKEFRDTIREAIHFLDNVIDMNMMPDERLEEAMLRTRKIGLGVMGFADALVLMGIQYDSEESLEAIDLIGGILREEAHNASVELAGKRGVFPAYRGSLWDELGVPRRNAAVTTIAPTGTISLIAGCSSSIEPYFALVYYRKHAEDVGEWMDAVPLFLEYLHRYGIYSEELLREVAKTGSVQHIEGVPEEIKRLFRTAHDIHYEWHVRIQAQWQKYIEASISKTINLPNNARPDDISKAMLLAYELGAKGVTVYRDRSKDVQVLMKPIDVSKLKVVLTEDKFVVDEDFGGYCRSDGECD